MQRWLNIHFLNIVLDQYLRSRTEGNLGSMPGADVTDAWRGVSDIIICYHKLSPPTVLWDKDVQGHTCIELGRGIKATDTETCRGQTSATVQRIY